MTNLNVSLPESMKDFIENEVRRGGYSTPSEFVRELVRDYQRRKATEQQDRLIDALLSGEGIGDDPALDALHQKLRARIEGKLRRALTSPLLPGDEVMEDVVKKSKARLKRRNGK